MTEYVAARMPGSEPGGLEEGTAARYYTFEVNAVRGEGRKAGLRQRAAAAVAGVCVAAVCIIGLAARNAPGSLSMTGTEQSLVEWGMSESLFSPCPIISSSRKSFLFSPQPAWSHRVWQQTFPLLAGTVLLLRSAGGYTSPVRGSHPGRE